MAQDAKQRQKKLARKAKKRKQSLAKKKSVPIFSRTKTSTYRDGPVYDCLVPDQIFDRGIGTVIFCRKAGEDGIAVSGFVIDVYCLGVKDALSYVISERDYKGEYRDQLMNVQGNGPFSTVAPADALKLIDGVVEYARDLGFTPHRDFYKAYQLFNSVDANDSTVEYEYGKDGKPFYKRGPFEDTTKTKQIIDKLTKKCGPGGFDFLFYAGDDMDMSDW